MRDDRPASWQRDLSVSYGKMGDLYDALGQGEQAREYYLKALEIAERLAQQDPGNAGWQRDVWTALWRLASIPGSKVTWAHVLTRMEAMKARGMLMPSDEEFLQEARTRVRT